MQLTQAQTDVVRTTFLLKLMFKLGFDFPISNEIEDLISSTVTLRLVYPEEFM